MKVSRKKVEPSFTPLTLNITVESQEEARALYAIFNATHSRRVLGDEAADRFCSAIGNEYTTHDSKDVIARDITEKEFYREHFSICSQQVHVCNLDSHKRESKP